MANSSEWIALAEARPSSTPDADWLTALADGPAFIEGLPALRQSIPDVLVDDPPSVEQASDPVAETYENGFAAGQEAAATDFDKRFAELRFEQRAIRTTFRSFDQAAMDVVAQDLADTVVALCSQVLADYEPDADALLERCRTAAMRLGDAAGECILHLHPDDIALIDPETLEPWRVEPDASVERAGMRLSDSEGSVSDTPADWRRAIAAAIGG